MKRMMSSMKRSVLGWAILQVNHCLDSSDYYRFNLQEGSELTLKHTSSVALILDYLVLLREEARSK